jgi:4'-phosphopantetheinyl transferase EntD
LAVTTRAGLVRITLRDEVVPALCSSLVQVRACCLEHELLATLGDREAYAADRAVPTICADAVSKRVAEHVAGRYLAARVLIEAGHPRDTLPAVGMSEGGAPIWPDGFVGSIAHGAQRVLAGSARLEAVSALGVDLERVMEAQTVATVSGSICVPRELENLERAAGNLSLAQLLTLVFSAKESLYKALHPQVKCFFSFSDVEARALDLAQGKIQLRLCRRLGAFAAGRAVQARFAFDAAHALTAVELPARSCA